MIPPAAGDSTFLPKLRLPYSPLMAGLADLDDLEVREFGRWHSCYISWPVGRYSSGQGAMRTQLPAIFGIVRHDQQSQ